MDYERLLYQYNTKVEQLEIVNHIIQILYLLPIHKDFFANFVVNVPEFEHQMAIDLEGKFEENLATIMELNSVGSANLNYETLVKPVRVKLGSLRSDFKDGLAKFFNKNTLDSISLI